MRHTVKAVFEHRSDAQHVIDELLASGYSRAGLALESAPASDEHLGAAVKHALAKLVGALQHETVTAQSDASDDGRHMVTFTVDSDPDAERAIGIIGRFGPVGVEDLHDAWEPGAVAGMHPAYPPGTEPGVLQHRIHEDSHYFGTQNAESPPIGNTFVETMGAESPWENPEEGAPHAAMPAPPSAAEGASGAEPDQPAAMDASHAGPWDKVKAAVRHGWDRIGH